MHDPRRSTRTPLTLAAAALVWGPGATDAQIVRPLPPPMDGGRSAAQGINASGVVVGRSDDGIGDETAATVWRPTPGGYVAEVLPPLAGAYAGGANAVNDDGLMVGYNAFDGGTLAAAAVAWAPSTGGGAYARVDLPVPVGAAATNAYAVNAGGEIAGYAADANDDTVAVVWSPGAGGYAGVFLPAFAGQTTAAATTINDRGDVAGYRVVTGDGFKGAAWLRDGGTYATRTVNTASLGPATVTALNDQGIGAGVADGRAMAVAYFEGEFYGADLPVPFDTTDSASNAVNAFDGLVGYAKDPDTATSGPEAALWVPTDSFWDYVNLDRWLDETDPALGALWTLTDATAVNDAWLVAGTGLFDPDGTGGPLPAVERGFVLDASSLVPEPASVTLLLPLAPLLLGRRRAHGGVP